MGNHITNGKQQKMLWLGGWMKASGQKRMRISSHSFWMRMLPDALNFTMERIVMP